MSEPQINVEVAAHAKGYNFIMREAGNVVATGQGPAAMLPQFLARLAESPAFVSVAHDGVPGPLEPTDKKFTRTLEPAKADQIKAAWRDITPPAPLVMPQEAKPVPAGDLTKPGS